MAKCLRDDAVYFLPCPPAPIHMRRRLHSHLCATHPRHTSDHNLPVQQVFHALNGDRRYFLRLCDRLDICYIPPPHEVHNGRIRTGARGLSRHPTMMGKQHGPADAGVAAAANPHRHETGSRLTPCNLSSSTRRGGSSRGSRPSCWAQAAPYRRNHALSAAPQPRHVPPATP